MRTWRGRVGLMVPSSNTTVEAELASTVPEGVSVHSARMHIVDTTVQGLERMTEDLEPCARLLGTAAPDVIAYACTTGSLLKGVGFDRELVRRIQSVTGVPAIATAPAVIEAFRSLGVTRLVVGTPYIAELDELERRYFQENEFEVLEIQGLNLKANLDIGRTDPARVYRLGKELAERNPDAEALFLSCTNLPTFQVIDALREDLRIPVLSSNLVTLWSCLKVAKVSAKFLGMET